MALMLQQEEELKTGKSKHHHVIKPAALIKIHKISFVSPIKIRDSKQSNHKMTRRLFVLSESGVSVNDVQLIYQTDDVNADEMICFPCVYLGKSLSACLSV